MEKSVVLNMLIAVRDGLNEAINEAGTTDEVQMETKATRAKKSKAAPQVLDASEGEVEKDIDDFLADNSDAQTKEPTIDDVRQALKELAGQTAKNGNIKARSILSKHTKGATTNVKDLSPKKYKTVLDELACA